MEQLRLGSSICVGGSNQHWMLSAVLETWARRTQRLLIKASSQGWRNPNGRKGIQGRIFSQWYTIVELRVRGRTRAERKIVLSLLRLQHSVVRRCFGAWYRAANRSHRRQLSPVVTPQKRSDGSPIPKGDLSIADILDRSLDQPWLRSRAGGAIVSSDDESCDGGSKRDDY